LIFRLLYIIQLPVVEWIVPKNVIMYVSSNADRGGLALFVCYINQLPVVERTQNVLYIIQLPTGTDRTQNLLSMIQRRLAPIVPKIY
jgi:hypothetical protein